MYIIKVIVVLVTVEENSCFMFILDAVIRQIPLSSSGYCGRRIQLMLLEKKKLQSSVSCCHSVLTVITSFVGAACPRK